MAIGRLGVACTMVGCYAGAGPVIAYRTQTHQVALGWKLNIDAFGVLGTDASYGAGIEVAQSIPLTASGLTTYGGLHGLVGAKANASSFYDGGFYATGALGLGGGEGHGGFVASGSTAYAADASDNGDAHWVVSIQLGVRRLPAGFEIFASPTVGVGAAVSDPK